MIVTFLRHGSNGFLVVWVLVLVALGLLGLATLSVFWVAVGALLFYLSEYSFHRFAFHARPSRWTWLRRMQHRLHYDHHAEPNRLDLLFLPIWFLVPNLILDGVIITLIVGAERLPAVLLGIGLAILHYEWVHYVAHIPYQPKTASGRWMKQYHLRHHFISEKHWFGVSNPSLDVLYGTYRAPKDVEKSATVRELYPS
ncbi:MAG TPA: sterol desaturase family protein [Roseiarcus sp.]|nr:sterol desaturase family protein [Roseiarcus sp.]